MFQLLRTSIFALPILALTALPASAGPQQEDDPSRLATEGLDKMVQALEALVRSIPQYEKPEINEYGDIIIRRKRPDGPRRLPDPNDDKPQGKGKTI